MNKVKYLKSKAIWILSLLSLTIFFSLLAWTVYDKAFKIIAPLTFIMALILLTTALVHDYRREQKFLNTLKAFETQWDNSIFIERLLKDSPSIQYSMVLEVILGILEKEKLKGENLMKTNENYSSYIESWVHEIKTPLALLQLILDNHGDRLPEDVLSKITTVEKTMENQVQQVLYYSRTQNCQKDFRLQNTVLKELCKTAVKNRAEALLEKNFAINLNNLDMEISTDRKTFDFILGQIIENSIKYMDKSQGAAISFQGTIEKGNIVLTVSDNGPGVPAPELPFIFDKGFTGTRGREKVRSTGMGLHIVSSLCSDLGIGLEAQSNKGLGLTIKFIFPKL